MASATRQVLETFELVENIIVSIESPCEIFVIQHVYNRWRADIKRSQPIRRRMFLHPDRAPAQPLTIGMLEDLAREVATNRGKDAARIVMAYVAFEITAGCVAEVDRDVPCYGGEDVLADTDFWQDLDLGCEEDVEAERKQWIEKAVSSGKEWTCPGLLFAAVIKFVIRIAIIILDRYARQHANGVQGR